MKNTFKSNCNRPPKQALNCLFRNVCFKGRNKRVGSFVFGLFIILLYL